VLFCNRKIEAGRPRLLEIGPTILKMFGVPVPDHMDGKPFEISSEWTPAVPIESTQKELMPVA
jgi:hypothetical protein